MNFSDTAPDLDGLNVDARARAAFADLWRTFKRGSAALPDWNSIHTPSEDKLVPHEGLKQPDPAAAARNLARTAVCKLNGGLGTSMGCREPKSTIRVRGEKSFLDLIVEQLAAVKQIHGVDVPLILMNSFYTHARTGEIIRKYPETVTTFQQNRFPRLEAESLHPLTEEAFGLDAWYPPGHGDFYACVQENGLLDRLLEQGREVLFVSNADNLGAVLDDRILNHMLENDLPFLMEMTPKTAADVKGGTLYQADGRLRLLEIARVPKQHVEEFCSQEKFKVFNTNNIWINLRHLKRRLDQGPLGLDVIVNRKQVGGTAVVQLETAIGSALDCFDNAVGLTVSRDRFMPVKKTDDLLLVQSDLFVLENARLVRNPARTQPSLPQVRLGKPFDQLDAYQERIPHPPGLLKLESLAMEGDVRIGRDVRLEGAIRLKGNGPLVIPDGTCLKDTEREA